MRETLRWIAIAAVVAVVAWSLVGPSQRGGPKIGGDAPEFSVPLLEGGEFSLAAHRGKVVVLDFWATWCGPCKFTLPALQEVKKRFENRTDVFVGTVNTDRGTNRSKALKLWLDGRKLSFPVLLDDEAGTIANTYQVRALPTLVVVGKDGKVASVQVGLPAGTQEGIIEHIEQAIEDAGGG